MSAPAENTGPRPCSVTTLMSSSSWARARASSHSSSTAVEMALRWSGRLSQHSRTLPCLVTETSSKSVMGHRRVDDRCPEAADDREQLRCRLAVHLEGLQLARRHVGARERVAPRVREPRAGVAVGLDVDQPGTLVVAAHLLGERAGAAVRAPPLLPSDI